MTTPDTLRELVDRTLHSVAVPRSVRTEVPHLAAALFASGMTLLTWATAVVVVAYWLRADHRDVADAAVAGSLVLAFAGAVLSGRAIVLAWPVCRPRFKEDMTRPGELIARTRVR